MEGVLRGIEYDDPLVLHRGIRVRSLLRWLGGALLDVPVWFATDVFHVFYLPFPSLRDIHEVDYQRKPAVALLSKLVLSDNYLHVHPLTQLNRTLSYVASAIFIQRTIGFVDKYARVVEKARGKPEKYAEALASMSVEAEEAVEEGARGLATDIKYAQLVDRFSSGEAGSSVADLSFEEYALRVIKLARNTDVKRILDYLTEVKPWMFTFKPGYTATPRGEIRGYAFGRELERVVPKELALPHEVFVLKYVEGKLTLYEKTARQEVGGIYVLVDRSGSMDGEKLTWAKAVALALLLRCMVESRDFYMRFFDYAPKDLIKIPKRPGRSKSTKFIEYIAGVRGSGGTNISYAVETACVDLSRRSARGVNYVVLITDGLDKVDAERLSNLLRRANAKLVTVMIGGDNESLRKISHKYFSVQKTGKEEVLRIVTVK